MGKLIMEARELMASGVYCPEELFERLYRGRRVNYPAVRKAVHLAKSSIYKEYN